MKNSKDIQPNANESNREKSQSVTHRKPDAQPTASHQGQKKPKNENGILSKAMFAR